MKRALEAAVFVFLTAALAHGAAAPIRNMTPLSLGAEYYGAFEGHESLYDFDSSALEAHFLRLHYAPCRIVRLSAGIGGSRAYADPYIKGAKTGLSAAAGVGVYTPRLLDFMRVTAGYDGYYLKASENRKTYGASSIYTINDEGDVVFDTVYHINGKKLGYTTALLHAPYAGLIFHAGRAVDIEIGGMYRSFGVLKKDRELFFANDSGKLFSGRYEDLDSRGLEKVNNQVRFYAAATLQNRESGAYVTGSVSYALDGAAEGKGLLPNLSFGWQVGLVMREQRGHGRGCPESAEYAELKARQDGMAGALSRRCAGRECRRGHDAGADEDIDTNKEE